MAMFQTQKASNIFLLTSQTMAAMVRSENQWEESLLTFLHDIDTKLQRDAYSN